MLAMARAMAALCVSIGAAVAARSGAPDSFMASDAMADTPAGFGFRRMKNGDVLVTHHGRLASTLRGRDAVDFLSEMEGADEASRQHAMARLTGNYRRGNERTASAHARNRR